uniref:NADH dehydrogenase subunit 11 n=1 Tax=Aureoumbra lagunensis TaxID=44058 RepID=A0A7U0QFW5_9STRA|nr:NADH dehydrogenase subunit 11 [Aureoumbra lagunensis]QQW50396.1 NADH dehydrogenase subunit 11 [Aureoumbra lagunensis]
MVKVIINNKEVFVSKDASVLEACASIGLEIPKFCYHQKLNIAGNCRMCLVEISKSPKPVASCSYPVINNLQIYTDTPLVKKARENILEFLLINHPLDCPICDQGGECDLQEQTQTFGSDKSRFLHFKRVVENKNVGPLIKTVMTRCIHCTKCVRFFSEISGSKDFGTIQRGKYTEISTYILKNVSNELSANVIDLCPVGALTSKPYAFLARPWELKAFNTIDLCDGVGSNLKVQLKDCEIVRVLPRLCEGVNEEWITDKTRFNFDSIKTCKIGHPLLKCSTSLTKISWKKAFLEINNFFFEENKEVHIVLSYLLDLSVLQKFKLLSNCLGKCLTFFPRKFLLNVDIIENFSFGAFEDLEKADTILTIGTNTRFEAPAINLRLKKRFSKGLCHSAICGNLFDLSFKIDKKGISSTTLFDIAEGKHSFCKLLRRSVYPVIIFNASVCERSDFFAIYKLMLQIECFLKNMSVNWRVLRLLSQEANQTGNFFLGFGLNKNFFKKQQNLNTFFCGMFKKEFLTRHPSTKNIFCFGTYQNTSLETKLILPSNHPYETGGCYMNTTCAIQKSEPFFMSQGFFRNKENLLNLLLTQQSFLTTPIQMFQTYDEKMRNSSKITFLRLKCFLGKSLISKTIFRQFFSDFYLADAISENSFTMAICSKTYRKTFTNFHNYS